TRNRCTRRGKGWCGVSNQKSQRMKDKWRQKQERKIMFWVVLVALLLATTVEGLIALRNYLRLH
ncbi:MAG: hypothetical protein ACLPRE_03150, partial [Limisphaerales bacterium]